MSEDMSGDECEGLCLCGRWAYKNQVHVCDPAREWPGGVRCAKCDRDISDPEEPKMAMGGEGDPPPPPPEGTDIIFGAPRNAPRFGGYIVCAECWTSGTFTPPPGGEGGRE